MARPCLGINDFIRASTSDIGHTSICSGVVGGSSDFEISLVTISLSEYIKPKKTCKPHTVSSLLMVPIPTSNAYTFLLPPEADSIQDEAPAAAPPMEFKAKPPPITLCTADPAILTEIRALLQGSSYIVYQPRHSKVHPATHHEYKEVMRLSDVRQLEFFYPQPCGVGNKEMCPKGLPPAMAIDDIKEQLSRKGVPVVQLRQLWKFSDSSEGLQAKTMLSTWIVTYPKEHKDTIYGLTGLFHFRITIGDLRSRRMVLQCYRCQEHGHTANFCKLKFSCRTCAGDHDSRTCTQPATSTPMCSNCEGAQPANSPLCPIRQRLLEKLRSQPSRRLPPPSSQEFPPLRSPPAPPSSSTDDDVFRSLLQALMHPDIRRLLQIGLAFHNKLSQRPQLISNLLKLFSAFSA